MNPDANASISRSSVRRMSRSAVGRASGAASRLLGGGSSLRATGKLLRRQLWAWPLIAAVVLGGAGYWVNRAVEGAMREQRISSLKTTLEATTTALREWLGEQRINAELIVADGKLRPPVVELLGLAGQEPTPEHQLSAARARDLLRDRLKRPIRVSGYGGFVVVAPSGVVLAADQDAIVGKTLDGYRKEFFDVVVAGKAAVSRPFRSTLLLADENGDLRSGLPTMITAAPVLDDAGRPIAVLGLRIRPEDHFTRILRTVRYGNSGETYAFDRDGLLLSQSRFDDELKDLGLLADLPDSRSILTIEIKDPQVNMLKGERPPVRRSEQPLTRLAADAVAGHDGVDADGYRDYRGVPSVGAWQWLSDYDFGVATEMDKAEAFQPVYVMRRAFQVLMVLLVLSAAGIFGAMLFIAHQQRALQRAALTARQLGQYTLEEKLGAGGMGTVYRARHAMLRRPTAIKLLDVDKVSDAAVARFEREVQLTGALTHPNTVAVFDYGRTPEGIFYYVMEYLEGLNLDDLVKRAGPLPDARVAYILRQVCGSLAEAHAAGLVHRDVKPANIFLTRRGGMHDFVKVLDFGLAKDLEGQDRANVTSPDAVMGTPLYLSPEAINQPDRVDSRSDVYALGAVGYFMLTGTPVFTGATVLEICMKHAKADPEPLSARCERPVSPGLESLLLRCLAKAPADRPTNAGELLRELDQLAADAAWTDLEAAAWWAAFEKAAPPAGRDTATGGQTPPGREASVELTVVYRGQGKTG